MNLDLVVEKRKHRATAMLTEKISTLSQVPSTCHTYPGGVSLQVTSQRGLRFGGRKDTAQGTETRELGRVPNTLVGSCLLSSVSLTMTPPQEPGEPPAGEHCRHE